MGGPRTHSLEMLELRQCLTAIAFTEHLVQADGLDESDSLFVSDLDVDGDLDIVTSTAWHENLGERGTFARRGMSSVGLIKQMADLDNDGDPDVLSSSRDGLQWFANMDHQGTFEPRQVVRHRSVDDVIVHDIDGDQDLDVLAAFRVRVPFVGEVVWYENIQRLGAGTFGPPQRTADDSRATYYQRNGAELLVVADMDGDADQDIVLTASAQPGRDYCGRLGWHENLDGLGVEFTPMHQIGRREGPRNNPACSLLRPVVVDWNNDGHADVLGGTDSDVILWQQDPQAESLFPRRSPKRSLASGFTELSSLLVRDLDNDGDLDVLISDRDEVVREGSHSTGWFENTDGNLGEFQLISNDARAVEVSDLDRDGDLDIVAKSNGIVWFESDAADQVVRLPGDADGSGVVDRADLFVLAQHYGEVDAAFEDGDFDGDGEITFDDFLILANEFGRKLAAAP